MRPVRVLLAVVLAMILTPPVSTADCVSSVPLVRSSNASPALIPGPSGWNGQFVVAAAYEEPSNAIWITLYSEDGLEISRPRKVAAASTQGSMALVWTGTEFGLFYRNAGTLLLQRLASDGAPIAPAVALPTARNVTAGDTIDAAWSDAIEAYVLARRVPTGIPAVYAMVILREGTVLREELLDLGMGKTPVRVAFSDSGVAAVFFYGSDGMLHVASFADGETPSLRSTALKASDFHAYGRGEEFFLVQQKETVDGTSLTRVGLDAAGNVVSPTKTILAPAGERRLLSVAARHEEVAVTYLDAPRGFDEESGVYRLLRITGGGSFEADSFFAAADRLRRSYYSEFAPLWTGAAYLSVVPRPVTGGISTYMVKLCSLTATIDAPPVVRVGTTVVFGAAVYGAVGETGWAWDFAGRMRSSSPAPSYTFSRTGTYPLVLEVTDESGRTARAELVVTVVEGKRRAVSH